MSINNDQINDNKKDKKTLFCVCKQPYNQSHFYIGCDKCEEWYHGKCVRINEEFSKFIDKYFCYRCIGNKVPSKGKFILKNHLINNNETFVTSLNSEDPNVYFGFNPNKSAATSRQKKIQMKKLNDRKESALKANDELRVVENKINFINKKITQLKSKPPRTKKTKLSQNKDLFDLNNDLKKLIKRESDLKLSIFNLKSIPSESLLYKLNQKVDKSIKEIEEKQPFLNNKSYSRKYKEINRKNTKNSHSFKLNNINTKNVPKNDLEPFIKRPPDIFNTKRTNFSLKSSLNMDFSEKNVKINKKSEGINATRKKAIESFEKIKGLTKKRIDSIEKIIFEYSEPYCFYWNSNCTFNVPEEDLSDKIYIEKNEGFFNNSMESNAYVAYINRTIFRLVKFKFLKNNLFDELNNKISLFEFISFKSKKINQLEKIFRYRFKSSEVLKKILGDKLGIELENIIYKNIGNLKMNEYTVKMRQLSFNLKKNKKLVDKIKNNEIDLLKLSKMSEEELASKELLSWRENINKEKMKEIIRDKTTAEIYKENLKKQNKLPQIDEDIENNTLNLALDFSDLNKNPRHKTKKKKVPTATLR